nr:MAG TPA: hypothetical protein [Caudoviricetes sp.]DAV27007.1 MAG TPA: hypothetical protein [Caudoviricetes sp.]
MLPRIDRKGLCHIRRGHRTCSSQHLQAKLQS